MQICTRVMVRHALFVFWNSEHFCIKHMLSFYHIATMADRPLILCLFICPRSMSSDHAKNVPCFNQIGRQRHITWLATHNMLSREANS